MEETITLRIRKKLKHKMRMLKHINWSQLIRDYLEQRVEVEEDRLKTKRDAKRIKNAVKSMDKIARTLQGSGWSGSEEVISWRKRRYSL